MKITRYKPCREREASLLLSIFSSLITFTGEKVISYTTVLGLGVNGLDGAVKEWSVFGIDFTRPFGDLKLFGCVGGVENAEILAVGADETDVVTDFGEKSDILALGNTHMSNYLTTALKMRHSLGIII